MALLHRMAGRTLSQLINITSDSTEPGMVIVAVYKPWITAENLMTAKGFTISVPHREQLETVWKLGQKYSGYSSKKKKSRNSLQHLT